MRFIFILYLCVFMQNITASGTFGGTSRGGFSASFGEKLSKAAGERARHTVTYNGAYFKIPYPNGDVPNHIGVCSDVVIRSYRALGIDLQKRVHEDMKAHFHLYPKTWGLKRPDTNIDHRRVPNLQTFFKRHGEVLKISQDKNDYKPGDIVTWSLNNGGDIPHIGIVTDEKSKSGVPLIVHNIGAGPKSENILFAYKITGHYRYAPKIK